MPNNEPGKLEAVYEAADLLLDYLWIAAKHNVKLGAESSAREMMTHCCAVIRAVNVVKSTFEGYEDDA